MKIQKSNSKKKNNNKKILKINLMIKIKNPILPSYKTIIKILKEFEKSANMMKKLKKTPKENQNSRNKEIRQTIR